MCSSDLGTNSGANTTLLGAVHGGVLLLLGVVALLKGRSSALGYQDLTAFAYELVKSRHFFSPFLIIPRSFCGGCASILAALDPLTHAFIIIADKPRSVKSIHKKYFK